MLIDPHVLTFIVSILMKNWSFLQDSHKTQKLKTNN